MELAVFIGNILKREFESFAEMTVKITVLLDVMSSSLIDYLGDVYELSYIRRKLLCHLMLESMPVK